MRRVQLLLVPIFALITAFAAAQDARKPATELPEIKELPDPFAFADGSRVKTPKDWERRRVEIKGLFQDYMYGHLPAKPEKMTIRPGELVKDETNKVTLQDFELDLEQAGNKFTLKFKLARPIDAKGKLPVIIQGAFTFGKGGAVSGKRYTPFTSRGYAVAEFEFGQLAPDNKDRFRSGGLYRLFGDKIDSSALMAWVWGIQRVIDALETLPDIDATRIIVTGHSRYGKTALLAGAFEERIALTVPSHSGCAGASPYRFIYGKSEQLHNIAGAFPHWVRPDFKQFVGNVNRLPVDQHELIALVAPRALLCTEGLKDAWINPEGSQLTYLAAKTAYEFLGAADKISIRFRDVGHIPSNEDLLDYADHLFHAKALPIEFGKLPYAIEKAGYSWSAPK